MCFLCVNNITKSQKKQKNKKKKKIKKKKYIYLKRENEK
jgi:hypothetical protein